MLLRTPQFVGKELHVHHGPQTFTAQDLHADVHAPSWTALAHNLWTRMAVMLVQSGLQSAFHNKIKICNCELLEDH